jgi:phosphatidylglycerophosphatase A
VPIAALARFRARSSKAIPPRPGPPDGWTLLAAWGPCGFSPVAPGTAGTLGAVPLAWALAALGAPAGWPALGAPGLWLGAALLFPLSVLASTRAGRYWNVVDASGIVVDEVIGYLVTMLLVPFSWPAAAAGFLLFRAADILKPWPASAFDRVKSGFGVVMDDVAAGVWAAAALWALHRWLPGVI